MQLGDEKPANIEQTQHHKIMNRYTGKSLEADIAAINETLAKLNAEYRLEVGYRYNYTAVDLATPEQLARHCCQRNLETGTPRQCLAAANAYLVSCIK